MTKNRVKGKRVGRFTDRTRGGNPLWIKRREEREREAAERATPPATPARAAGA